MKLKVFAIIGVAMLVTACGLLPGLGPVSPGSDDLQGRWTPAGQICNHPDSFLIQGRTIRWRDGRDYPLRLKLDTADLIINGNPVAVVFNSAVGGAIFDGFSQRHAVVKCIYDPKTNTWLKLLPKAVVAE